MMTQAINTFLQVLGDLTAASVSAVTRNGFVVLGVLALAVAVFLIGAERLRALFDRPPRCGRRWCAGSLDG